MESKSHPVLLVPRDAVLPPPGTPRNGTSPPRFSPPPVPLSNTGGLGWARSTTNADPMEVEKGQVLNRESPI